MDITLPPDFKEFLRLLNTHGVEYLLIGGYAVEKKKKKKKRMTWIFGLPSVPRMPSVWSRYYEPLV